MSETEAQRLQREQIARQLRLLPPPSPAGEPDSRPWPPNLRLCVLAALEQVRSLDIDAAVETLIALDLELGLLDAGLERTSAEWALRAYREDRDRQRVADAKQASTDPDAEPRQTRTDAEPKRRAPLAGPAAEKGAGRA